MSANTARLWDSRALVSPELVSQNQRASLAWWRRHATTKHKEKRERERKREEARKGGKEMGGGL